MLRAAALNDRDVVLPWRNHPQVRSASLTRHEIGPEEHAAWWARSVEDPCRRVLIYERAGVPSGVVTFDISPSEPVAAWGFYLDVIGLERRGELVAAWVAIERESLRYAFEDLGAEVLRGEVLADNVAVRRLHHRHGIREPRTYERVVEGRPELVVLVEMTAEEYRMRSDRKVNAR